LTYYPSYKISNAYATNNGPLGKGGSGPTDIIGKINDQLKDTWPLFIGGAAINLFLVGIKFAQGPIAKWWTVGGIIALILGGYGAVSSGFTFMGKPLFGGYNRSNYGYNPYPNRYY
jgi:hypothetical protein